MTESALRGSRPVAADADAAPQIPDCPDPAAPALGTVPDTASTLHVAIIMDGNGRWATARGRPRTVGHRIGARTVRRIVETAPELGIGTLTLYAFSADNWRRPPSKSAP